MCSSQVQESFEAAIEPRLSTPSDARDPLLVKELLRVKNTVEQEGNFGDAFFWFKVKAKKISPLKVLLSQSRDIQRKLHDGQILIAKDANENIVGFGEVDKVADSEQDIAVLKVMVPEKNKKSNVPASIVNSAEIWADEVGCSSIRLKMEKRLPSDSLLVAFFVGAASHLV